jgi:hypothetical protein
MGAAVRPRQGRRAPLAACCVIGVPPPWRGSCRPSRLHTAAAVPARVPPPCREEAAATPPLDAELGVRLAEAASQVRFKPPPPLSSHLVLFSASKLSSCALIRLQTGHVGQRTLLRDDGPHPGGLTQCMND